MSAREIARAATELHGRLIIVGVRHHHVVDRLLGRETSLRILQHCRLPLYVVPPNGNPAPRRVLIATDFTAGSVVAARTALELFPTIAHVYLVHVAPRPEQQLEAFATWMSRYDDDVRPAFERLEAELGLPPSVTVETISRDGRPAHEILKFVESTPVDLMVAGSRGARFFERLAVGSTARALLRAAPCAVLAVRPPARVTTPYVLLEPERDLLPAESWARELAAFTERNAGRLTTIEVDDVHCGAQAQEHGYPLRGVAYDHQDCRVDIMVGTGTNQHLTRGIAGVRSIDILHDARGRDWILRVTHDGGETTLILDQPS